MVLVEGCKCIQYWMATKYICCFLQFLFPYHWYSSLQYYGILVKKVWILVSFYSIFYLCWQIFVYKLYVKLNYYPCFCILFIYFCILMLNISIPSTSMTPLECMWDPHESPLSASTNCGFTRFSEKPRSLPLSPNLG